MKCLSIRQPWAWLIVYGYKDVENRTWPTSYHGPVLIHAASRMVDGWNQDLRNAIEYLMDCQRRDPWTLNRFRREGAPWPDLPAEFELGGIIGMAYITDCVSVSVSRWFTGPYGFVLEQARPLPLYPMKGRLGLFDVPDEVAAKLGVL